MSNMTLSKPMTQQYVPTLHDTSELRKAEVLTALRLLGADEYDMLLPETRSLPRLLFEHETIFGVIYGKYRKAPGDLESRGMIVVTDRRILLVDKKPLFLHYDEIKFDVLSGIKYGRVGLGTTVVLSTRMGEISIRTFNSHCASQFVRAVEDVLSRPHDVRNWQ